jgi:phage-related protein
MVRTSSGSTTCRCLGRGARSALQRIALAGCDAPGAIRITFGIGVSEIRIREGGAFRLIYVAKFSEAIYVLHAFQKKTQKTGKADVELARTSYRAMLKARK